MEYKIKGQVEKVEKVVVKTKMTIRLELNNEGNVFVVATDEATGLDWCLLELRTDGTFHRAMWLSNKVGFRVDGNRIQES